MATSTSANDLQYSDASRTAFMRASATFNRIIDRVESRCMAADGPVTPTLKEISEAEMSRLWRSVQSMRAALGKQKNGH